MAITQICLDMDGVLCDFMGRLLRLFGRDVEQTLAQWPLNEYSPEVVLGITRAAMWDRLDEIGEAFWANLDPYPWFEELVRWAFAQAEVTVCTCPSNRPPVAFGKILWLQRHLGSDFDLYQIGTHKHVMARRGTVLIDDSDENCRQFFAAGGHAIVFPRRWNSQHEFAEKPMVWVFDQFRQIQEHLSRRSG